MATRTVKIAAPRPSGLPDWRCHTCGALLARLRLSPGSVVQIKCKCNAINTLEKAA